MKKRKKDAEKDGEDVGRSEKSEHTERKRELKHTKFRTRLELSFSYFHFFIFLLFTTFFRKQQ